jgi:hypothetical protein
VKKSLPYEIIAAVLAMIGAFILVTVYYPPLNPVQFKIDSHQSTPPVSHFIFVTPIPLLILSASWYFNCKAQRLKREEIKTDKPSE